MNKYEVQLLIKVPRQISVEAESLEKAIHNAKEIASKEYPDVTWENIVIEEIEEDFI